LEWPKVHSDWPIEFSVKINNKSILKMQITQQTLSELNLEKTIELVKDNEKFKSFLKNRPISSLRPSLYVRPYLNASLNFIDATSKKIK
jgi:hypothetical protein